MISRKNRYMFIGSVEYSAYCLETLLGLNVDLAAILCPVQEVSRGNSDYCDLGQTARKYNKNVHYFRNINSEAQYIAEHKPDIVFVLGFSQIIGSEILKIPSIGFIGSHPALLPQNRGRHPIIWAIANGLTQSGITLFWIDKGVDSGDIWVQKTFDIKKKDDARTVYGKVVALTRELLIENVPEMEKGIFRRIPQDHSRANYWRKRTNRDGMIDWRMSSARIYNLVRALSEPYVGAHCIYGGKEIKILKASIVKSYCEYINNVEPAKVLGIRGSEIMVKTGDGVINIIDHGFDPLPEVGEYLDHP